MKFKYDEHNIPYLSRDDIDAVAEKFLAKYQPENLSAPRKLSVYKIIDELEKNTELRFDLSQELGFNPQGKTLGLTKLDKKEILIDREFAKNKSSKRLFFTIAHEIGHFAFHTNKPIIADGEPRTTIIDTDKEFYFNGKSRELNTVLDLVEWQANSFASSILMPRQTFQKGLKKVQRNLGINRNLGIIFIDKQPSSKRDFKMVVTHLSNLYNVPQISIKIRLDDLNLVDDRSEKSMFDIKRIGDII